MFNSQYAEITEEWHYYISSRELGAEDLQKNMNIARKLALNLARIYKNKNSPKLPMSHIMFDCLMNPNHLLAVLGKN